MGYVNNYRYRARKIQSDVLRKLKQTDKLKQKIRNI